MLVVPRSVLSVLGPEPIVSGGKGMPGSLAFLLGT